MAADAGGAHSPFASLSGRAATTQDAAGIDLLLAVPGAYLVVDGYNVTKSAYPAVSLADQRARLIAGLALLAARSPAEVTVVFDGADVAAAAPAGRGVRVVFSPSGVTADSVIARLLAQEPRGRAVVVVSSDGEVAAGSRRAGAYPVPSLVLAARLDRG